MFNCVLKILQKVLEMFYTQFTLNCHGNSKRHIAAFPLTDESGETRAASWSHGISSKPALTHSRLTALLQPCRNPLTSQECMSLSQNSCSFQRTAFSKLHSKSLQTNWKQQQDHSALLHRTASALRKCTGAQSTFLSSPMERHSLPPPVCLYWCQTPIPTCPAVF